MCCLRDDNVSGDRKLRSKTLISTFECQSPARTAEALVEGGGGGESSRTITLKITAPPCSAPGTISNRSGRGLLIKCILLQGGEVYSLEQADFEVTPVTCQTQKGKTKTVKSKTC